MDKNQTTRIGKLQYKDALRQATLSDFDNTATKLVTHSAVPWRQAYVVNPNPQFDNTGFKDRPWVIQKMLRYHERIGDITQSVAFLELLIFDLKSNKQLPPLKRKMNLHGRNAVNASLIALVNLFNLRSLKVYGSITIITERSGLKTVALSGSESITRLSRTAINALLARKIIEVEVLRDKKGRKYKVIYLLENFFKIYNVAMQEIDHAITQQQDYESRGIKSIDEAPINKTEATARYREKIEQHKSQQPIKAREKREEKKEQKAEIKQLQAEKELQKQPLSVWEMAQKNAMLLEQRKKELRAKSEESSQKRIIRLSSQLFGSQTDPPDK